VQSRRRHYLAAWKRGVRRKLTGGKLFQRAKDDATRTTISLSRRQVRATSRAGNFLGGSRAFLSSGVPERSPGAREWPVLSGRMKDLIQTKSRSRRRHWAVFVHPDEKKTSWGPHRGTAGDALTDGAYE
jgi:hypothetical protein